MLLAALNNVTSHDHFLKDEICLVKVENQIQLTNISKVLVQHLNEVMDDV